MNTQYHTSAAWHFWRISDQLDVTSYYVLFHFLCAQHVSDINTSIIRSLRLFYCITTLVVCSCIRVAGFNQLHGYHPNPTTPKFQHTSNQEHTTNVVIQQNSRRLLMMDILMSETCWAHKKWNRISSDIKLVSYSSTITMMHGPIYIRFIKSVVRVRHKNCNYATGMSETIKMKNLKELHVLLNTHYTLLYSSCT